MTEIQHVTKEVAVDAGNNGGTFYHRTYRNADGSAVRCRVNGKCQVWKTRPTEFRLPCKVGFKDYYQLRDSNCEDWLIEDPTSIAVFMKPYRTSTVVELAAVWWWNRDVGSVLADALEEAGYINPTVLNNLRTGRSGDSMKHKVVSYLLPENFDHETPPGLKTELEVA